MDERLDTGAFILRNLVQDIDLEDGVRITCVELWEGNLYIGTSSGDIVHHYGIPGESPNDPLTFIFASRQTPPVNQPGESGIQQILILPAVEKACIISNGTLSFYTLPELTPAPPLRPLTCAGIGGVDLDASDNADVVMMCLRNKIRLVKVAQEPLKLRDIEFGGCLASVRRGDFACVADSRSYALLDVAHQQKVPLFPISSTDDRPNDNIGVVEDVRGRASPSPLQSALQQEERGHRKTASLNLFRREDQDTLRPVASRYGFDSPQSRHYTASRRTSTSDIAADTDKPLPTTPDRASSPVTPSTISKPVHLLRPLIASPASQLFLLVTGTAPKEPSVGMFVNLDGDVDRGTIEFSTFPEAIIVDGNGADTNASTNFDDSGEEGYVLALVQRNQSGNTKFDIEIQRWDVDPGESNSSKEWLNIPSTWTDNDNFTKSQIGLRSIGVKQKITVSEIASKLTMRPIHFFSSKNDNANRLKEEVDFIQRLCQIDAHITIWHENKIFWVLRNPLVLKLDSRLRLAQATSVADDALITPQRELIESIFNDSRGSRSNNELDYFSFRYIRQKAALLLFFDLVLLTRNDQIASEEDKQFTEQALAESEVDPRLIIALLPKINQEISKSEDGIWTQAGIEDIFDTFIKQVNPSKSWKLDAQGAYGQNMLQSVKRFLLFWRRKKGNPSVVDGRHIFPSVDAAILHTLLMLDELNSNLSSPISVTQSTSTRAELYSVVDNGVDCFERAVELLEQYNRLYVLSRLYGKRKSSAMVLSTWKRILENDQDVFNEFIDGENEMRKYLGRLKDKGIVIEYGTWLANRNPKIGVQVFADENSKIVIPTTEALGILREKSPNAVKEYLEYLVFGKKQSQHINELIAYYLDIVLRELESSSSNSRIILSETYITYRALKAPKPTYRQFITENSIDEEWWHSRLRLLHLLGSSQSYDVLTILDKLQPFVKELVPEMIILNGQQGRHEEAIRLLTHGLGDFDTAISYCLLGGSSIFRPPSGYISDENSPTKGEQALLFNFLLLEFLAIEDDQDRMERTGELLERFSQWFEVSNVLNLLPAEWSIDVSSEFIVKALQRLIRDKHQSVIVKALTGAQNLQITEQFAEKALELGPTIIYQNGNGGDDT